MNHVWKKVPDDGRPIAAYSPGKHPEGCPLVKDCYAVSYGLNTLAASQGRPGRPRWIGSSLQPYIGSDLRMHVAVAVKDEVRSKWEGSPGPSNPQPFNHLPWSVRP